MVLFAFDLFVNAVDVEIQLSSKFRLEIAACLRSDINCDILKPITGLIWLHKFLYNILFIVLYLMVYYIIFDNCWIVALNKPHNDI